jgi:glycosyltransferase involved in cell wall biosynthesis
MPTLAYNIDPLLQEPTNASQQSILDAIPALTTVLPGVTHLAFTSDQTLKLADQTDASTLQLIRVKAAHRFWQNPVTYRTVTLHKALITNNIDLFFTSSPISIPKGKQYTTLLICDAATLLNKANYPKKRIGPTPVPAWVGATAIIVPHQQDRMALSAAFPQLNETVRVVLPVWEEPVEPLDWSAIEQVKLRYSAGRDFFLYAGDLAENQQLIHLLKAYALLKKWLMTSMPLVLAGAATEFTPRLEKMLQTYKYRADVTIYKDTSTADLKELVAAAYALVQPTAETTDTAAIQWAFSAGTPVIAGGSSSMIEFTKEAAQLSAAGDNEQLAHAMMILYKDEFLRNNLIQKGKMLAMNQNRASTLARYQTIISGLLHDNS